jgi:hydroxypyruvate isomerase
MPKLAANLTLMFADLPFLERLDAAADAGFRGVEWMFSYEIPAAVVRQRLDRLGLKAVLFNLRAGDWDAGDRGIASSPNRIEAFRASVDEGLAYAQIVGCPRLHVMAGRRDDTIDRAAQISTFVDNLRHAAKAAAAVGVALMVEPLNRSVDMPGYLIAGSAEGMEMIDRVNLTNVRLQYDVYHMQIVEGDLARTIERLLPRIGHIQIADNPGRNEPGTGEIAYGWLLGHIDRLGYDGWIGCEYRPRGDTRAGLGWASHYLSNDGHNTEKTR